MPFVSIILKTIIEPPKRSEMKNVFSRLIRKRESG